MTIPTTLSTDPYAILHPDDRWRPGQEELSGVFLGNMLPPLVDKIRRSVYEWRKENYPQISDTSRALLHWWFCRDADSVSSVRYYFAQREAVESVIFLYEHETKRVRDKFEFATLADYNFYHEII